MAKRQHRRPGGPRDTAPWPGGHRDSAPWLYGLHAVAAALANPARRCRRLVVAAQSRDEVGDRLAAAARAGGHGLTAEVADRRDLEALLPPGAVHQGVGLLAEPLPEPSLEDVLAAAVGAPLVVLDQATDPRNVGAVLRSAAAFGVVAVVVQDRHAPPATAALAKAASGALEKVPLVRVTNLSRALDAIKAAGYWITGLDGRGEVPLPAADLAGARALVLGAEGRGLRRLVAEHCDTLARIPMTDAVESLNLSNAAAIALYELARHRT
ncbi:MAG: 23S rRNA (guanosine(2251)-2'-O)-methyltransferase RlmB [Hyphomicrobiales bacterium]|nr:23S rRNA (guanosine(2251)-2'-O)-methyltransferase RlmB [Hyphomicrobiales bacterium]MCP5371704.1 23S rRNA (guanosine(2251)-2'-O)-methyltransferase RlmB [Hyphomicrobiales bacterium]